MEYLTIFTTGACGYAFLEYFWRGYSHWTMEILGGICFVLIYLIEKHYPDLTLWKKCLLGTVVITSLEFITGVLVNILFDMAVWDYSDIAFNILGQICAKYSALWYLLCIPLFGLCSLIQRARKNSSELI